MSDNNGPTGAGPLVPGVALPARARAKRKGRKPPARSRRASGSRPPAKAAGQARAARSSSSPAPEACDCLAVQAASESPVGAQPDIAAVVPQSAAEIAADPDEPAITAREPAARSIDPTGEMSASETAASVANAPASTDARPVADVSDIVAASAVGRGRVFARRGLAAILSTGLIGLGAWALQPGLGRTDRPVIAAAPVDAMPVPAGSPAGGQDATQAMVSPQGAVDSGRPSEGWTTPPTRVSRLEVSRLEVSPSEVPIVGTVLVPPLVSPPDTPIADSQIAPTVDASGIAPPAAPALVPLPPRRPASLALRRTFPVPPEVSSAAVAAEPVRADANVWSPPREAGRYRLPWGVAQLGERGNDDTARGPQWTFAVER